MKRELDYMGKVSRKAILYSSKYLKVLTILHAL